ncbi:hypothetical protein [Paenibacillus ginsengarvi]|uniref:Uncharacterized protein n=1 Tax=Paenibacillus ginsengarvi TaxID=400777 RepID=A0A3B0CZP8_9BACL|nr:hypothetical protein [Paenibacillus ginsengarvi]RKN86926.1 hypothetical protein D7M11_02935 [Paenibacillus ginsengarvi]
MPRYWLTPIVSGTPVTLGGERILCSSELAVAELQRLLKLAGGRLVPFKAHLLAAGDEAEATCGTDRLPFDLATPVDIVFDGERLSLSHCGQTMLDKLSGLRNADEAFAAAETYAASGTHPEAASWIAAIRRWCSAGWNVILLREEP